MNAGEIADIPDLDGDGPHEDEERIARGLGACRWMGQVRGLGRRRLTWMISLIWRRMIWRKGGFSSTVRWDCIDRMAREGGTMEERTLSTTSHISFLSTFAAFTTSRY